MSLHLLLQSLLRRKVVTGLLLVQLAMTLALLLNSIVLAGQTWQKLHEDTGLDLTNSLTVELKPTTPALRQYPALADLLERQMAAVRALPGVVAVAYSNQPPLQRGGTNGNLYDPDNQERSNINNVPVYQVSKDFFDVLQIKVLEGELPQAPLLKDGEDISPLVLTQSLAQKLFPNGSAVGRQTNAGTVAAVVDDFYGQRNGVNSNYNRIQVAPLYSVDWGYNLLVRTEPGQADAVQAQLAKVLQQVDSNIEILYLRSFNEEHNRLYRNEFGLAVLLGLLSVLMLLVTMVSSYSNAHFHALKRQQEIGIKRALGASKNMIFMELFCENWLNTVAGAMLGAVAALALNQGLSAVVSIPAISWWLPLLATLVLLICVSAATWYPARIATSVSPATATKTL
ncbi:FtsX-like permease family protein [Rheinheimera sp. 4Y26]|uniref:FtsX-like permease family protein n=1 Tax=Rheinheimera sp. 4Y26 TaxID=2977811 RepID=UPI0021B0A650|nr:FtsX-like permease family protein [Rheinheimera sp. 4Y26]MCT6700525.1 FtsX-like permease family protein [Rheinheimera sp. 4Y26]